MTAISITPVVRDDVIPLVDLELREDQKPFVASNAISLAQAAYEPGASVFCIRHGDTVAGLVQYIDMRTSTRLEPGDDPNSVYLWRLMIGPEFQRQGLGRSVLKWLDTYVAGLGIPRLTLTVVPTNQAAVSLYLASGYHPTGRIISGEAEYEKLL